MSRIIPLHPHLPLPVIGFVGASGSGKTTLITGVLPHLAEAGLRVGVLKHARHGFDIDRPGKDSYRAREAGAAQVLVASNKRWVLMGEATAEVAEPPFRESLARFNHAELDLILAEGFAGESYPKIEVHRPSHGEPFKCWPEDPAIVAVASDARVEVRPPVALLDINSPGAVAEFVLSRFALGEPPLKVKHGV